MREIEDMDQVRPFIPNEKFSLNAQNVEGDGSQNVEIIVGDYLGSGYSGRVDSITVSGEEGEGVVLKTFKPASWLKNIVSAIDYAFVFRSKWRPKAEIERDIIGRDILASITLFLKGEELVARSWRRLVIFISVFGAWAMFVKKCDIPEPRHGRLAGAGHREVEARAKAGRELTDVFQQIGADDIAFQAHHYKGEPRGVPYILFTLFISSLVALLGYIFSFSYIQVVDAWLAVLCLCYIFAGASWLSADNLYEDKKSQKWKLLEIELGMPHIGYCPSTAIFVGVGIFLLWRLFSLSWEWIVFFALLTSPGYLFLFELPLIIKSACRSRLIATGGIDVRGFIEQNYNGFVGKLGKAGMDSLMEDVALYERLDQQAQSSQLDIWNRLWLWLAFGQVLPFSWQAVRGRTIERWKLNNRVSSDLARWLEDCFFLWFFLFRIANIFPWRFIGNNQYRKWKMDIWRARRIEVMVRKGKVSPEQGADLFDAKNFSRLILSYFLPGGFYRFVFDKDYRIDKLLVIGKALTFFWRKQWVIDVFKKRFKERVGDYQQIKDNLKARAITLASDQNSPAYGWVVDAFLILASKLVYYPPRIALILGFFGTKELADKISFLPDFLVNLVRADFVQSLPGWAVGIILWIAGPALFKLLLVWGLAWMFRLRLVPAWRGKGFIIRGFLDILNVIAFVIFGILNAVPLVSWFSAPLAASLLPQRKDFWLLFLIRWQTAVTKAVNLISMGIWKPNGTGDFLFRVFLVNPVVIIVNKIFCLGI